MTKLLSKTLIKRLNEITLSWGQNDTNLVITKTSFEDSDLEFSIDVTITDHCKFMDYLLKNQEALELSQLEHLKHIDIETELSFIFQNADNKPLPQAEDGVEYHKDSMDWQAI